MMNKAVLLMALSAAGTASAQPGEPGPGEPHDDATAQFSAEESLDAASATLRRARDGLMAAEEFQSALLSAEELVTTLRSESATLLALDLLQLARIQTELADLDEAELNFLEAIRLLAGAEGEFSMSLVEPYQALGRAYIRGARYTEALAALQQAQHVSQRNLGLFNTEQTALLDDMTIARLGTGDTVEAERLQVARLNNAVRRYGARDARVIPYRYQLADYYERSRLLGRAREQYLEIIDAQQNQPNADATAVLAPLRAILHIDLVSGERGGTRDRLGDMLADHPDIDPAEQALSLAALGDWALAREGEPAAAHEHYRRAYATLAAAESDIAAAELFSQPVMLDFVPPLTTADRGRRSRPYAYGTITLAFSISEDGRPWHVEAVAADPPGLVEGAYVRRLREAHFRPRLVAGEPAETRRVELSHRFRYYVED